MSGKRCVESIALVGILVYATYALIQVVQYEPLGPGGSSIRAVMTVPGRKGRTECAAPMAGSTVLTVRFIPTGKGMNARVRTNQGWYELFLHYADWDRNQQVTIVFDYESKTDHRKDIATDILRATYFAGIRTASNLLILHPPVEGDLQSIAISCKDEHLLVKVHRTSGLESEAGFSASPDSVIELELSP